MKWGHMANAAQVHVRKVKLLKAPKFDLGALLGLHGESNADDSGQKVQPPSPFHYRHNLTIIRSSASSRRPSSRRFKRTSLTRHGVLGSFNLLRHDMGIPKGVMFTNERMNITLDAMRSRDSDGVHGYIFVRCYMRWCGKSTITDHGNDIDKTPSSCPICLVLLTLM
jgi:hypothetical protein